MEDGADSGSRTSGMGMEAELLSGNAAKQAAHLSKSLNSAAVRDKLDALRKLVMKMSQGQDMSEFFADVVKNVVSPSLDVRKFVYAYLVRYAESKPEMALMSINSIQKGLEDPNPLIRAMSLRVMSSIRVRMIVPLIVLAIRRSFNDSSAYVRKVAALAVPKVYALDPERKDELIEMIEQLLKDKSTVVLGATIVAYEQICPNEWDIIHPHYRKLCSVLVDCDEWSQVVIINCLLRYSRKHFVAPLGYKEKDAPEDANQAPPMVIGMSRPEEVASPNAGFSFSSDRIPDEVVETPKKLTVDEELKNFYSDDDEATQVKEVKKEKPKVRIIHQSSSESSSEEEVDLLTDRVTEKVRKKAPKTTTDEPEEQAAIDPDLRLLLRGSEPLLQSRNAAVIFAVSSLYFYTAPRYDCLKAAKSIVRLLKDKREVRFIVLTNLVEMTKLYPSVFAGFVTSFWVNESDSNLIRFLKLKVLTNIASESNIGVILREMKGSYLKQYDKDFAAKTIQAIGSCALRVPSIANQCVLIVLEQLTAASSEIITESILVLKNLLLILPTENIRVISRLASIIDKIQDPFARASIIWTIGEFAEKIPTIAPDCLRKLAKDLPEEEKLVKLQILTMAVKCYLKLPNDTEELFRYVVTQCAYDLSFDVRDRTRLIRNVFFNSSMPMAMKEAATRSFLEHKPTPRFDEDDHSVTGLQFGSLSNVVGHVVDGFIPISDFAAEPSPASLRAPFVASPISDAKVSASWEGKAGEKGGQSESGSSYSGSYSDYSESGSYSDYSSGSESYSESESDVEEEDRLESRDSRKVQVDQNSYNLLDDFNSLDLTPSGSTMPSAVSTPTIPMTSTARTSSGPVNVGGSTTKLAKTILSYPGLTRAGLEVSTAFARNGALSQSDMASIQFSFTNIDAQQTIERIWMEEANASDDSMEILPFYEIRSLLRSGRTFETNLSVRFTGRNQSVRLTLCAQSTTKGTFRVPIEFRPTLGELCHPYNTSSDEFQKTVSRLKGLNEAKATVYSSGVPKMEDFEHQLLGSANLYAIQTAEEGVANFACVLPGTDPVFTSLSVKDELLLVVVSSEDSMLGMQFCDFVKSVLQ